MNKTGYLIPEERMLAIREVLKQALRLVQVVEASDEILLPDDVKEQAAIARAVFEEHSGIGLL